MDQYRQYAQDLSSTLAQICWEDIDTTVAILHEARMNGNLIVIMGNGGSAATALHMACDLGKNTDVPGLPRVRVLSLTDNMALFSAHANDNSYENVFSQQVENLVREGDVAIAISTSGKSPNVLNGIDAANALGATTIGLCGHSGGTLATRVDVPIIVPNNCIEQIEDVHMIMEHIVTVALRDIALSMPLADESTTAAFRMPLAAGVIADVQVVG